AARAGPVPRPLASRASDAGPVRDAAVRVRAASLPRPRARRRPAPRRRRLLEPGRARRLLHRELPPDGDGGEDPLPDPEPAAVEAALPGDRRDTPRVGEERPADAARVRRAVPRRDPRRPPCRHRRGGSHGAVRAARRLRVGRGRIPRMIKLYHAPRTRSVRIHWLLEELGIPYTLETVDFVPPSTPFAQRTPFGKFPAIEDGDVKMFESGAILEYILERYGKGRLAPPPGPPAAPRGTGGRPPCLRGVPCAEAPASPPMGNMAWHMMFRQDADQLPGAMADYRGWALAALDVLERGLAGRDYLLGGELSGADIMMGYTVIVAKWLGLVDERHANVAGYLARLQERPALRATVLRRPPSPSPPR